MEELQPLPVAVVNLECTSCFGKVMEADQFCQSCGFPLKGSEEEQRQFTYNRQYQQMEINGLAQKVKSARNALFVTAGLFLLNGLAYFAFHPGENTASAVLITYGVLAVIFLLLAWWAEKKPLASLISGMVLYVLIFLMDVIADPRNLYQGVLIRIIVVVYLVKGLMSAMEAEKIRKQYNL